MEENPVKVALECLVYDPLGYLMMDFVNDFGGKGHHHGIGIGENLLAEVPFLSHFGR